MNIKQIEIFISIAETLSFSETASNIYLSQPAITKQIKNLENELGFRLFERNKRNVTLTLSGQSFYDDCKVLIDRLYSAIYKAKQLDSGFTSVITIGYEANAFELEMLPRLLRRLKAHHKDLVFSLKEIQNKFHKKRIMDNDVDINFTVKENAIPSDSIDFIQIYSADMVCIMSKNHSLRKFNKIDFSLLDGETLILLDPSNCPKEMSVIQNKLLNLCKKATFIYSNSFNTTNLLVQSDNGIAVMPDFVSPNHAGISKKNFDVEANISYGIAIKKDSRKEVKRIANDIVKYLK